LRPDKYEVHCHYIDKAFDTVWGNNYYLFENFTIDNGGSESKERFAIQRYLLIIGKKQNMQVLSHTFTYFST